MTCYKANPISRDEIREYIKRLKSLIGYENDLYFPVVIFMEYFLPVIVPGFSFEIVSKEEMGNKHGETFPNNNYIRIREDVYDRAVAGEGRDRLTIAHEIGHLFMHREEDISLCRLEPGSNLAAYEDPEWQANVFGGELLASSYLIDGMTTLEVSRKCGVSRKAANTQLRALEKHKKDFMIKR